ncbi:MAG: glycosyltransferase family 2 protein, partial [Candidatus Latescibacterota bacterium]
MTATTQQRDSQNTSGKKVAVLLPCYNEEVTIGKVVGDFRNALPFASVYVFDNNSSDQTAGNAAKAGAIVVYSPRRGKGNVVKHMFREVDADIYVMADGDDTYPADMAGTLIEALEESGVDMVVGTRLAHHDKKAFRAFHGFGNTLISKLISLLFSSSLTDVLSGYRVFSRHFARTLYLTAGGFEVETEMTLQALVKNCFIKEIPVRYSSRPEGSESKLNTFSDGLMICKGMFLIFKDYRPFVFFSALSISCFLLGLV